MALLATVDEPPGFVRGPPAKAGLRSRETAFATVVVEQFQRRTGRRVVAAPLTKGKGGAWMRRGADRNQQDQRGRQTLTRCASQKPQPGPQKGRRCASGNTRQPAPTAATYNAAGASTRRHPQVSTATATRAASAPRQHQPPGGDSRSRRNGKQTERSARHRQREPDRQLLDATCRPAPSAGRVIRSAQSQARRKPAPRGWGGCGSSGNMGKSKKTREGESRHKDKPLLATQNMGGMSLMRWNSIKLFCAARSIDVMGLTEIGVHKGKNNRWRRVRFG
jgi:hypothetical protein